jgi:hypothetical protein
MKYANFHKFDNPSVLRKSLFESFGGIASVMDEELRAFRLTEKLIEKKIRKYDIGKIYKEELAEYEKQQRFQNYGHTNPRIAENDKTDVIDLEGIFREEEDCIETSFDSDNDSKLNRSFE